MRNKKIIVVAVAFTFIAALLIGYFFIMEEEDYSLTNNEISESSKRKKQVNRLVNKKEIRTIKKKNSGTEKTKTRRYLTKEEELELLNKLRAEGYRKYFPKFIKKLKNPMNRKEAFKLLREKIGYIINRSFSFHKNSEYAKKVIEMINKRIEDGRFDVTRRFFALDKEIFFDKILVLSLGFSDNPICIEFLKELYTRTDVPKESRPFLKLLILSALAYPKDDDSDEYDRRYKKILFNAARVGERVKSSNVTTPTRLLQFLAYDKINSSEIKNFLVKVISDEEEAPLMRARAIFFLHDNLAEDKDFHKLGDLLVEILKDPKVHHNVRTAAGYALRNRLDYYFQTLKEVLLNKKITWMVREGLVETMPVLANEYDEEYKKYRNLLMDLAKDKDEHAIVRSSAIIRLDGYVMYPEVTNLLLDILQEARKGPEDKTYYVKRAVVNALGIGTGIIKRSCKELLPKVQNAFSSLVREEVEKKEKGKRWSRDIIAWIVFAQGLFCGKRKDFFLIKRFLNSLTEEEKDKYYRLVNLCKKAIKQIKAREKIE